MTEEVLLVVLFVFGVGVTALCGTLLFFHYLCSLYRKSAKARVASCDRTTTIIRRAVIAAKEGTP